ncbi:Phosphocarrier protein HPr [Microbacterium sp. 8M]|jgi:phosphotransferase system HPr (HPr) family protein|uniref:HPr family phosphocarrier protein n=1 Tax=Microbacterium sp. 8M TaxID=2653153 RepID=UPI0012F0BA17|nr:HPr family phosphocarrier protein [Microbacterium sp. 8M]VXB16845.1 Phosphocarrier protein HPr [Microbacterium sp. 8M]
MPSRSVVIRAEGGAHARPVAELVRLSLAHQGPVGLTTAGGRSVDLGSVLAVMDLALVPGDEVVLTAEGPGAERLLETLAGVLDG